MRSTLTAYCSGILIRRTVVCGLIMLYTCRVVVRTLVVNTSMLAGRGHRAEHQWNLGIHEDGQATLCDPTGSAAAATGSGTNQPGPEHDAVRERTLCLGLPRPFLIFGPSFLNCSPSQWHLDNAASSRVHCPADRPSRPNVLLVAGRP